MARSDTEIHILISVAALLILAIEAVFIVPERRLSAADITQTCRNIA